MRSFGIVAIIDENFLVLNVLGGEECDEWHYGTPAGDQAAVTVLEGRTISPQQVQEYCPLRTTWSGDLEDLAYCRE